MAYTKNNDEMTRSLYILILFIFVASNTVLSQDTNCYQTNNTFAAKEKLSYIVSYNWFVVFSEVGLVDFTIKEDKFKGVPTYHFKAEGRTFNWWDSFFKVRDSYETWIRQDNMRPMYFQRNTREGDYRQHENYIFEGDSIVYRKNKTYDNPFSYDTIRINNCAFDVMSSLLYTRNLDYSNIKVGDKIPVTIVLDEKAYDLYFRYLGIEDKKVKGVGTFECKKFTVLLVEGTLFHGGEDMLMWVTNDKNHIPVFIQSPIIIGSVRARISEIEGNRYPLTSKK